MSILVCREVGHNGVVMFVQRIVRFRSCLQLFLCSLACVKNELQWQSGKAMTLDDTTCFQDERAITLDRGALTHNTYELEKGCPVRIGLSFLVIVFLTRNPQLGNIGSQRLKRRLDTLLSHLDENGLARIFHNGLDEFIHGIGVICIENVRVGADQLLWKRNSWGRRCSWQ